MNITPRNIRKIAEREFRRASKNFAKVKEGINSLSNDKVKYDNQNKAFYFCEECKDGILVKFSRDENLKSVFKEIKYDENDSVSEIRNKRGVSKTQPQSIIYNSKLNENMFEHASKSECVVCYETDERTYQFEIISIRGTTKGAKVKMSYNNNGDKCESEEFCLDLDDKIDLSTGEYSRFRPSDILKDILKPRSSKRSRGRR